MDNHRKAGIEHELRERVAIMEGQLAAIHGAVQLMLDNPHDVATNNERLLFILTESEPIDAYPTIPLRHKPQETGQVLVVGAVVLMLAVLAILALAALAPRAGAGIADGLDKIAEAAPPVVDAPPLTRGELAGIPLTEHANSGHPERNTGAAAIRDLMASGGCRPLTLYVCADQFVVTCPGNTPGLTLGLFVGRHSRQVITGMPARDAYWDLKQAGCYGPMLMP